jgi:hypothetical protein
MRTKLARLLIVTLSSMALLGCVTDPKRIRESITPGANIFHAKGLIGPGEYLKRSGEESDPVPLPGVVGQNAIRGTLQSCRMHDVSSMVQAL